MIKPGSGDYIEADGIRTYFVHRGSGPALVLLHGQPPGGSVHVVWHRNIEAMADAGFSVYAFDSVGFGRSEHDPNDYSRERRVRHALAFIDAMGLDRYSMWGMSDGSNLACRIALRDSRVERMVLQASGSLSPRPPVRDEAAERAAAEERAGFVPSLANARTYLEHSLTNQEAITDEMVEEMYAMSSGRNLESHQRRQALPNPPIYDELKALTIPVMLMWGANDSPMRGLLLFQKIPGAELHIFDNCGHWIEIDQTERVHTLVEDFLTTGQRSRSPAVATR